MFRVTVGAYKKRFIANMHQNHYILDITRCFHDNMFKIINTHIKKHLSLSRNKRVSTIPHHNFHKSQKTGFCLIKSVNYSRMNANMFRCIICQCTILERKSDHPLLLCRNFSYKNVTDTK